MANNGFLIHKMAKNDSWKVSEPADPNKWSRLDNPYYVPGQQTSSSPGFTWPTPSNPYVPGQQKTQNPWKKVFSQKRSSSQVMTQEEMVKKEAAKKYRSIDDPWEVEG